MAPGELARRQAATLKPKERLRLRTLAGAFLAGFASEATRNAYASDLRRWLDWCEAHNLDPLSVRRPAVDLYARECEHLGRAQSTVARRLATISGFYTYLVDEEIIKTSPVANVKRPKLDDDSQTLGLDRRELRSFLDAAEAAGPRDYALVCLLALNGLRVSEACAADVSDLATERGHRVLAVTRKGRTKKTLIPLAPATITALEAQVAGRTTGPLLLANDGSRLDRFDATRVVKRLTRRAGIGKRISPHSLRHSFVTAALDAGVPLRDVQDAAGHRDPRTTRRYDRSRENLDRHATYRVAAFLADAV